ncbi:aspartate-semialdehyde dehydrogenase [Lacibacterium aquatile]|uniref:Aspartate-semialdehyde dehydrogenase n=1 Tax=Lacibacterium aquatile TaxID=1168082 RepID=A0ABW5DP04_9PROT
MAASIAVIGATGSVGREILMILAEQELAEAADIVALASDRSVGQEASFGEDDELIVRSLKEFDFAGIQYAFFAIDAAETKPYALKAAAAGAMVIDCSPAFRLEPGVPLIVPEVNAAALSGAKKKIVANPSPLAIMIAAVVQPLHAAAHAKRAVVTAMQPVSGLGRSAMDELFNQTRAVFVNDPLKPEHFTKQIAFNVIPHVGDIQKDGETTEEATLAGEARKLIHPDFALTATCVRVPVFIGQSATVTIEFENALSVEAAREHLKRSGITVIDHRADEGYVTPVEVAGDDPVFVSRVREDKSVPHGLTLWCATDNLRKGAALNAVQIFEALQKKKKTH